MTKNEKIFISESKQHTKMELSETGKLFERVILPVPTEYNCYHCPHLKPAESSGNRYQFINICDKKNIYICDRCELLFRAKLKEKEDKMWMYNLGYIIALCIVIAFIARFINERLYFFL